MNREPQGRRGSDRRASPHPDAVFVTLNAAAPPTRIKGIGLFPSQLAGEICLPNRVSLRPAPGVEVEFLAPALDTLIEVSRDDRQPFAVQLHAPDEQPLVMLGRPILVVRSPVPAAIRAMDLPDPRI